MWTGILLIVLGVLALPHLFLDKSPEGKALMKKWNPIVSIIGAFFVIWGIWSIISSFLAIGMITTSLVAWLIMVVLSVVTFGLGFILAFPLLKLYVFVNKKEKNEGEDIYHRLRNIQTPMGIIAIILGVLSIIYGFLWT